MRIPDPGPPRHPERPRGGSGSVWLRGLALFGWLAVVALAQPAPAANSNLRVGFLASSLGNSNPSDVKAAMKIWMLTVAKESQLSVQPTLEVFNSVDDMVNAIRQDQLEVFSLPTDEFFSLEKQIPIKGMFASQVHGKVSEEYVLLVHKDRVVDGLKDLRGEPITVLDNQRSMLAMPWVELELKRRNLPASGRFFGKITRTKKAILAILPVFFKQAAAALVTRSSFEIAGELNPQLLNQLRVLNASPKLVPGVGAYRKNAGSAAVNLYRTQTLKLGNTPAGKLILNLFQIDGMAEVHESDLAETRAFLAEYARLKEPSPRKGSAP